MLRMAITGGIACGKSLTGAIMAERGIPVCDSDNLAHEAILKGSRAYRRIVAVFGRSVLDSNDEISRSKLGRIVFNDPGMMKKLNAIVHPEVRSMWRKWVAKQRGKAAVAVMIPLLYETAEEKNWDRVVCVGAPEDDQRARLKARGLTAREIRLRMAAQMPVTEKMGRADHVIYNCGSVALLREQTVRVLNELLERKHA